MTRQLRATQSCLTLCNPMDCSLPGSFVHGISQARILEWVAISFSWCLPEPGIEPVSFALAGGFFTTEPGVSTANPIQCIFHFQRWIGVFSVSSSSLYCSTIFTYFLDTWSMVITIILIPLSTHPNICPIPGIYLY